jgi:hypothetical protein
MKEKYEGTASTAYGLASSGAVGASKPGGLELGVVGMVPEVLPDVCVARGRGVQVSVRCFVLRSRRQAFCDSLLFG